MTIPEEEQAAALREVADAAERRQRLIDEAARIAEEEIRPAAVRAAQRGADRSRIRVLARVGPAVLYRWFEEAGIPVRPKSPPKKGS